METIKVVSPGTSLKTGRLYVTIHLRGEGAGRELSIRAAEGPTRSGECKGSCGQAREMAIDALDAGWTVEMVDHLRAVWERWHLNGARAGSQVQEDFLRAGGVKGTYEEATAVLARAGLNPDPAGYRYGSAWKFEELEEAAVCWLLALPDASRVHPWGDGQ